MAYLLMKMTICMFRDNCRWIFLVTMAATCTNIRFAYTGTVRSVVVCVILPLLFKWALLLNMTSQGRCYGAIRLSPGGIIIRLHTLLLPDPLCMTDLSMSMDKEGCSMKDKTDLSILTMRAIRCNGISKVRPTRHFLSAMMHKRAVISVTVFSLLKMFYVEISQQL